MAAVNSRYARAFVDVVLDEKLDAAAVRQELEVLSATLDSSLELRRVWENPAIAPEQKRGLLDAIVQRESLSRPVRNFAAVLIDHRRIGHLAEIVRTFQQEMDSRLGIEDVEVTSSRELTADEKSVLERQVEQMTGKKVRATFLTDRAILGGAVLKLGSTIYDGSVRGQLRKLRDELAN